MMERSPFTFFNAHYKPGPESGTETGLFTSIWTVRADPTYQVRQPRGFQAPGIFCTYQGQGLLRLVAQKRVIDLTPGTFFTIDQHVECYYECPADRNWNFYFIHCRPEKLFRELGLEHHLLYQDITADAILRCGEGIIDELIRQDLGFKRLADLRLEELLVRVARLRPGPHQTGSEQLQRVIHWMNYNLDKPLRIETAREMSGLGRTVLFREFKNRTGKTPLDYFLGLKLRSAQLTLETTRKKVAAIAASLGFYDEYHFSKMFKRVYGLAPARYRRKYLQHNAR
jgi:AraC-like DNA-binding protein